MDTSRDSVPVARYAVAKGVTREIAIREVQRGEVVGGQDERGRWVVARAEYDRVADVNVAI